MIGKKTITDCGNCRIVKKSVAKKSRSPSKVSRARKMNKTSDAHARSNKRASGEKIFGLVQNNFCGGDFFLTLTYAGSESISPKQQKKDLDNFLRRMKYRYDKLGKELLYVGSMERAGPRPHDHVIINAIEEIKASDIEMIWGKGMIKTELLKNNECYKSLSDYLIKESVNKEASEKRPFSRAWKRSRNLKKPESVTVNVELNSNNASRFLEFFPDVGFQIVSGTEYDGIADGVDVAYASYIEKQL